MLKGVYAVGKLLVLSDVGVRLLLCWILSCDGFPLLVQGLGLAAPYVAAASVLDIQG